MIIGGSYIVVAQGKCYVKRMAIAIQIHLPKVYRQKSFQFHYETKLNEQILGCLRYVHNQGPTRQLDE